MVLYALVENKKISTIPFLFFYTKQCVSRNLNELFNDILRIGNLHVVDTNVLLRKDESLGLAEKRNLFFNVRIILKSFELTS